MNPNEAVELKACPCPAQSCDMGMGCDEAGKCYAEEMGEPDRCARRTPEPSGEAREKVARIIDPQCFTSNHVTISWRPADDLKMNERARIALAKADEILAALEGTKP